ncbi:MAG TPA: aminotransferase class III-fold pyridoxal phosphate-dependent enzyme [Rhodothermia bacterium]
MADWLSTAEIAAHRPKYSLQDAERLVTRFYGIDAIAAPLPSDRDQNFRMVTSDGRALVLRLASTVCPPERLRFELTVLSCLQGRLGDVLVPPIVPAIDSAPMFESEQGLHGCLVGWLTGKAMGEARPSTPELLSDLGRTTAAIDDALSEVEEDGQLVASPWDLLRAHDVVEAFVDAIEDPAQREIVMYFHERFLAGAGERLSGLPRQVVHGDLNDYNLLVGVGPEGLRLTGILDFGDAHKSARIVDPVIAAAYALLPWDDPIGAAATVARAYNEVLPLTDDELHVFLPLLTMRLCASVCISAHRRKADPDDDYIMISQAPAWRALTRLRRESLDLGYYRLRAACGKEPFPDSAKIIAWIDGHRDSFARVTRHDLATTPVLTLDLSVSSAAPYVLTEEPVATREIASAMNEAGAEVAIGRYDEVRLVYSSALFEAPSLDGPVQRTVHIGVDVFLPAGEEVSAPIDGVIYGFDDNAEHLSYGPTIILRHEPSDCPAFYTLYGHLHRADLPTLKIGQPVARGTVIGHVGDPSENGGWTPHLHFQLILDMLDKRYDFPGVCSFQDRDVWTSLCPDPSVILGLRSPARPTDEPRPGQLLRERHGLIAPSLSISYHEPLLILRASGSYMFDHAGRRYLDCVNNVNHIGHCHPGVTKAVSDQMAVLNSNTRYLHPTIVEYARRLTATLPAPLSVCYFVNSGSEANDLALRLARAHTGRPATVVLDAAYHGHLTSMIDISPYKFAGPGGHGPGRDVFVAPLPDVYRGMHRGADAADKYAHAVHDLFEAAGERGGAAAFISESLLSCGGQIELPAGYLRQVYDVARRLGVVCIADEVQVGFGRVGTHFWGFETQDVVPDIVTMGKPIGNGHPLAAVVTTPEIAGSFNTGMEYFNTYGGNPVSCAAGLAVLEAVQREGLQEKALETGSYLKDRLLDLRDRFPLIGDVRGRGLFLGVELVTDLIERTPAGRQADYVINRARRLGVLLSTDGPDHNVLKIKPPLTFSPADADRLVETLDRILQEDPAQA